MAPSIEHTLRRLLESDLHSKVQLPHLGVGRQAGDQSGTIAVDAVIGIVEIHVIEDVERFEPELRAESLRDREVLEQRDIGVEEARSGKGVASAAKLSDQWALERSRNVPVGWHRSYRGVERELCL